MSRHTIREPAREIPIWTEADVLVCGGGPAGVGAALAAARSGARTVLVENQVCLGGMATAGMVNRLGPYHDQKEIILKGIPWEILRGLIGRGLAQEPIITAPENWSDYWLVFDPEGMKKILDEKIEEAGVTLFYDTRVVRPLLDDDGVSLAGAVVEGKSGRGAIPAKVVIDATGDADLTAMAGAPYTSGRDGDGLLQPATLFFKCLHMDWPKTFKYVDEHYGELIAKAREEEGIQFLLPGTDSYLDPDVTYFNCLHEHGVDATDTAQVTHAVVELRKKLWANVAVLRRHVPGCEHIRLDTTGSALGVRETRRVVGEAILTLEDVLEGRQFDDQVFRHACFVDIHHPDPKKRSEAADRSPEPGQSYGVPYGCLLPKKVENLLVAGRCLSATHEALASVRMMPSCMAMGQAAGTAAAMSVDSGTTVRTLDRQALRKRLATDGVNL